MHRQTNPRSWTDRSRPLTTHRSIRTLPPSEKGRLKFLYLYGSVMTLSGLEYLLFVKKEDYLGTATGTFVNRNHLAGYLEMALAIGLGLMLMAGKGKPAELSGRWRGRVRSILRLLLSQKAILRLMLVAMVVGLILTRSRMGNTAFFNSLLITGFSFRSTFAGLRSISSCRALLRCILAGCLVRPRPSGSAP